MTDATIVNPHLASTPSGSVAYIHLQIAKADIQHMMGPAIQEVYAVIKVQSAQVAGAHFTVHHAISADGWDFDVCVPVASPVFTSGRVLHKVLTPHQAATASYLGPYEGLHTGWLALRAWMDVQGYQRAAWICEVYETGPASGLAVSEWKTQLYQPIVDS
jgi:effector-binding domain-containing protein